MTLRVKRGTRAKIDLAANRGELLEGEPLFITDEDRLAVGTSPTTYESFAKQSESGGGGGGVGVFTTVKRTSNQTIPTGTPTKVSWNTEFDNTVSAFSSGTPTRITVPSSKSYAKVSTTVPVSQSREVSNDVALLLHMNGTSGSTTFTDSSIHARTVTAFAGANLNTTTKKYGTASASFSSGANLRVGVASDWTFLHDGKSDWTIEFYMYLNSIPGSYAAVVSTCDGSTVQKGLWVTLNSSGNLEVSILRGTGGTWCLYGTSSTVFSTAQFYEISLVYVAYFGLKIYVNGVLDNTIAIVNFPSLTAPANPLVIGGTVSSTFSIDGYIDELRITNNAIYLSDYIAHSEEFTNVVTYFVPAHYNLKVLKNNTVISDITTVASCSTNNYELPTIAHLSSRWFAVTAGDYLELQLEQSSSYDLEIISDATYLPAMQVEFI